MSTQEHRHFNSLQRRMFAVWVVTVDHSGEDLQSSRVTRTSAVGALLNNAIEDEN